jgi:hypothetical protein
MDSGKVGQIVEWGVRTEDDNYVNIARINGGRVWMWRFALQSGRGDFFRSLSTIIRSISTTTFALNDRNPLITNQVHSGRKVQLDNTGLPPKRGEEPRKRRRRRPQGAFPAFRAFGWYHDALFGLRLCHDHNGG